MPILPNIVVVLIIFQLHHTLIWSTKINYGDCIIIKLLLDRFQIDSLSARNELFSKLNDISSNMRKSKEDLRIDLTSSFATHLSTFPLLLTTIEPISTDVVTGSSVEDQSKQTSSSMNVKSSLTTPKITSVGMGTIGSITTTIDTYGTAEINQNATIDMATTIDSNVTSYDRETTMESLPTSEKNLALILGLTLGLALPICLVIIGSSVYYFKVYRPRHFLVDITNT
ncbi:unnamed protein product [Rotaria magnacalcarata]|uniref:Uncharacterized protein n=1 Tax=Rotaria magnacalcarata TaxID=392030 RepID=A0A815BQ54_9BILA|nr:unnamed protein product [Rotaria magnacalcarata]CAF1633926.1 unnamed protein product [Rotaria magnacalcarata]CAF2082243.1 unnamed protein product [Rotaria magnacalcarata]